MKRLAVFLACLLVLGIWLTPGFCASPYRAALRLKDGKVVSPGEMFADLRSVDLIFIGEDHDDLSHHQAQLQIIGAFHEEGVPLAIGLEMFRTEAQDQLDLWSAGQLDQEAFIRLYYANWQAPWPLYRDILLYAREHQIPLIGLNITEALSRKIAREGFASLSPSERKELPPGISCSVDPRYMDFIRRAFRGHTNTGKPFVNFCEAQMVWDKAMAWRLVEYRKKNPSRKIVVLAGSGHAWRPGIPEQAKKASKYSFRVVLPGLPNLREPWKAGPADADYLLLR